MRRSLLISAIALALSAPVTASAHELTLGYVDGKDYYATYYKAALGIDETVAALVQGSDSQAVEAIGLRLDLSRYDLHGELDVIQSTTYDYTQIEYRIGW